MIILVSCKAALSESSYMEIIDEKALKKEFKSALSISDEALNKYPESIELYSLKGTIYLAEENFYQAEVVYTKTIKLMNESNKANSREYMKNYQFRSVARKKLGMLELAIDDVRKAIEIDNKNLANYAQLMFLYVDLNDLHNAELVANNYLDLFKIKFDAHYYLCEVLYDKKLYHDVIRICDEILSPESNYMQLSEEKRDQYFLYSRALSYIKVGDIDKAIPDLIENEKLWSQESFTYGTLAFAYFQNDQIKKAKESYKKAIEIEPKYKDNIDSLEGIFNGTDEAKAVFKEILKLIEAER